MGVTDEWNDPGRRPMTTVQEAPPTTAPEEIRVKHRTHWGWWVVTAVVLLFAAAIVRMLITNPNLQWDVVAAWFFSRSIIFGLLRTLELTVLAMFFGILLGMITAVMRLSPIPVLSSVAWFYTWFFRGTPLLVQIIFWYNLAALLPTIEIGIPFVGPVFWEANTNVIVTPFLASVLALALNEGAYMAEIVRGGIVSVDPGQQEAAAALGMRRSRALRRIIFPQAMRVIVPPTGNQVISMLKSTSLVSVTSMPELLYSAQLVYNRTFQTIPLLIVASIWYLIVTSVLMVIQYYIERRYARGGRRELPPTPWQKFKRMIARFSPAPTATATGRA
jgi:polar amino acid transport system permease protein